MRHAHRFLDLPDEVKSSLPMNKENFAYILGWSDENLTGMHNVANELPLFAIGYLQKKAAKSCSVLQEPLLSVV